MKLQFDAKQEFQLAAVDSTVDLFDGQHGERAILGQPAVEALLPQREGRHGDAVVQALVRVRDASRRPAGANRTRRHRHGAALALEGTDADRPSRARRRRVLPDFRRRPLVRVQLPAQRRHARRRLGRALTRQRFTAMMSAIGGETKNAFGSAVCAFQSARSASCSSRVSRPSSTSLGP